MDKQFPRTTVAGVSLPRMIIGTNWLMGFSHTGDAQDKMIQQRYSSPESFYPIISAYLEYGIDAIMGPISQNQFIVDGIEYARQKSGKNLIIIDTPILNVDDNEAGRKASRAVIKHSAEIGSTFAMIQHSSGEQLLNKNTRTIERIGDYTAMIRDAGMLPGMTTHVPEMIRFADANDYDIEIYSHIYNCLGFMMQVEIEHIAHMINHAKHPVITIKAMAAGRCTPFVGLNFNWSTIRPTDLVAIGCYDPGEVHEDVEISRANFEHRWPNLAMRTSPDAKQPALSK